MYSTYVTSYTNFSQEKGKYVRDHVFDPEKLVTRPGVAAIILMLNKMNY
jgi:lysozyme family protein